MIKRLLLVLLIVGSIGGVAAYYLVPWNAVVQNRVMAFLKDQGFNDVTFNIDKIGLHQATLKNIVIGTENPFRLQSVTVQYDPRELKDGTLRDLTLTGLDIGVRQTEAGWQVDGLSGFPATEKSGKPAMTLSDLLDILPFSTVSVTDSHVRITGTDVQAELPFTLHLAKSPERLLDVAINASQLTAAQKTISLGAFTLQAKPDNAGDWTGIWNLESFALGDDTPLPVMGGVGTVTYKGRAVLADGNFKNTDGAYTASFKGTYDMDEAQKNVVTVTSLTAPFKEGRISAKNVVVPLQGIKPITINLQVQKVSIDALMQTLTGKRVSATGTVSGAVPVIIKRDGGGFALGRGSLKADSDGLIQMPGDVIPGDNEQVTLVRQILENLHYKVFTAGVETDGGKKMTVHLSLEGNNPDVYNGRPVKLNVNLTGDLLDFVQQNAMLITNPEKLLKQGTQ